MVHSGQVSPDPRDPTPWDPDRDVDEDDIARYHEQFPWQRSANPNTADGELQNMAAFSSGFSRLSGPRRRAAQAVVWLILLGFAVVVFFGILGIAHIW
jgi:hypothetical protein